MRVSTSTVSSPLAEMVVVACAGRSDVRKMMAEPCCSTPFTRSDRKIALKPWLSSVTGQTRNGADTRHTMKDRNNQAKTSSRKRGKAPLRIRSGTCRLGHRRKRGQHAYPQQPHNQHVEHDQ